MFPWHQLRMYAPLLTATTVHYRVLISDTVNVWDTLHIFCHYGRLCKCSVKLWGIAHVFCYFLTYISCILLIYYTPDMCAVNLCHSVNLWDTEHMFWFVTSHVWVLVCAIKCMCFITRWASIYYLSQQWNYVKRQNILKTVQLVKNRASVQVV